MSFPTHDIRLVMDSNKSSLQSVFEENGQSIQIVLSEEEIFDTKDALTFCQSSECGGISIFMGMTRNREKVTRPDGLHDDFEIEGLVYECYTEMTLNEIRKISLEVLKDFPDVKRLYICHRVGKVVVGNPSIIIAASAPHRSQPQELVSCVLNEVKKRAPIWKKVIPVGDQRENYWSSRSEAFWLK